MRHYRMMTVTLAGSMRSTATPSRFGTRTGTECRPRGRSARSTSACRSPAPRPADALPCAAHDHRHGRRRRARADKPRPALIGTHLHPLQRLLHRRRHDLDGDHRDQRLAQAHRRVLDADRHAVGHAIVRAPSTRTGSVVASRQGLQAPDRPQHLDRRRRRGDAPHHEARRRVALDDRRHRHHLLARVLELERHGRRRHLDDLDAERHPDLARHAG